jgi:type IV conjugative transfer system lipoprotein TraV
MTLNMKSALLLAGLAVALSACSSSPRKPDYICPLNDNTGGACASVEQAYKASKTMKPGTQSSVQSVFDPRAQTGESAGSSQPFFTGQATAFPDPTTQGAPVFKQPKVMRVWTGPYVDAEGNLRSGEYAYFSTPGRWNYGDLKKPGEAGRMMAPVRPNEYGFNAATGQGSPKAAAPTAKAPAVPAEAQAARPTGPQGALTQPQVPASTATAPANAKQADSITQPYQRLTQ